MLQFETPFFKIRAVQLLTFQWEQEKLFYLVIRGLELLLMSVILNISVSGISIYFNLFFLIFGILSISISGRSPIYYFEKTLKNEVSITFKVH